jgi:hypothetical protein
MRGIDAHDCAVVVAVTYALIEKPGQKLGATIIAALRARRPSPSPQTGSPVAITSLSIGLDKT